LKTYLKNNNIPYEEHCLRRFIHNFDKDSDFSIDYNEFLGIVLSKRNSSLANSVMYRENKDSKLENNVENTFNKLLIKELNLVKTLISIADELKYSKEFTTYEAYISIVKDQKYITQENLAYYLRENNVELDSIDPIILMFRIDADNDGKISYEEFQEIFFPYKSNYSLNDITINKSPKINYNKRNFNNEENNEINLPKQNYNNNNYYKLNNDLNYLRRSNNYNQYGNQYY
jgi:Ca2+-binding EF-hand superfamily protein